MQEISPRSVFDNLRDIRRRISAAAQRAGRDPASVEPMAVVKYAALSDVRALLESGSIRWFAENKAQDALKRRTELASAGSQGRWRFIGHLQSNKVNQVLGRFDSLDSLDSVKLAEAVEKRLQEPLDVLIQIKLSEQDSQSGIPLQEVDSFLRSMASFPKLKLRGLMAIAPVESDPERLRPHFRAMKQALDRCFANETEPILSMGMSNDFEVAVEEGASIVRIGSALFGPVDSTVESLGGTE